MTDADFRRFLAWLSPDAQRAARRYMQMQFRLAAIFSRHGCDEPPQLADEALDRAASKVEAVARDYRGDPQAYVLAIARKLVLEQTRRQQRRARRAGELAHVFPAVALPPEPEGEHRGAVLDRCLGELDAEERRLILMYYGQGTRPRSTLAQDTRLSRDALRKRTQRIRQHLRAKLMAASEAAL